MLLAMLRRHGSLLLPRVGGADFAAVLFAEGRPQNRLGPLHRRLLDFRLLHLSRLPGRGAPFTHPFEWSPEGRMHPPRQMRHQRRDGLSLADAHSRKGERGAKSPTRLLTLAQSVSSLGLSG